MTDREIDLSVVVMAHPKRREWAEELADQLDAEIVWDQIGNVWDTGRRALLAGTGTHVLVIQDDAIPAKGLIPAIEHAIEQWPQNPISLYAGRYGRKVVAQVKRAQQARKSYWLDWGPRWGVATVTPTDHIEAMVKHGDAMTVPSYDDRMQSYWESQGLKCVYTCPSLVQHRPVSENPSLADERRTGNRHAVWFEEDSTVWRYGWQLTPLSAAGMTVQFYVDPDDHIGRRIIKGRGWYERDLLDDMRRRVRPGVGIDVGAHIGNHTVWMAMACDLDVVALEPNSPVRNHLHHNVQASGAGDRVEILDVAAGAKRGQGSIHLDNLANTGTAKVRVDPDGEVKVVPIDDLEIEGVTVIKIDVEGEELDVLQGAMKTIRRDLPVLYIEINESERLEKVDDMLAPLGYQRFGRYAITPTYGYEVQDG